MLRILGAVYKCISNLCHYLPMCILHAHEIIIIIIIIKDLVSWSTEYENKICTVIGTVADI